MYTLYEFEDGGYAVMWNEDEYTMVQDYESQQPYVFSGWVSSPIREVGTYPTLNDAWWEATIDSLMYKGPTDERLSPYYSFRYKKAI